MKFITLTIKLIIVGLLNSQKISNQYIVTFNSNSKINILENIQSIQTLFTNIDESNKILHTFDSVLNGVSVKMNNFTLERVKALPNIKSIEQDQVVKIAETQFKAPWGLSRISKRSEVGQLPYNYYYDKNAGKGVNIYVLDTGINISHNDFKGSASWGTTTFPGSTDDDLHGHGTHCAGIAVGSTYGVAKKAKVIAVKVLGDDGVGSNSACIAGINWVLKNRTGSKGNIISMSLAGGFSAAFNEAVNNAVSKGVIVVAGAGNDVEDACKYSPASASKAITVGAIGDDDYVASFSNYGKCVDIHGPGVDILSAWRGSKTAFRYMSGTSMATPHISGIVATLLSKGISANNIENKIKSIATRDKIVGLRNDTVNLIGYNGYRHKVIREIKIRIKKSNRT